MAAPVARAPRRWPLAAGMLALGFMLGIGTLLIIGAALTASTSSLTGSLTLNGAASNSCVGYGGYSDIRPGASVTVRDADGTVVATGGLEDGTSSGYGCTYPFTIDDVPRSDFYTVEVSHRGQVTFNREAVERGDVSLTLGS